MECLQWLVEEAKIPFQVRDTEGEESGVTPAHFAAQGRHLDCLQVSGRMCEWVDGCAVCVISAYAKSETCVSHSYCSNDNAIMFLDI